MFAKKSFLKAYVMLLCYKERIWEAICFFPHWIWPFYRRQRQGHLTQHIYIYIPGSKNWYSMKTTNKSCFLKVRYYSVWWNLIHQVDKSFNNSMIVLNHVRTNMQKSRTLVLFENKSICWYFLNGLWCGISCVPVLSSLQFLLYANRSKLHFFQF